MPRCFRIAGLLALAPSCASSGPYAAHPFDQEVDFLQEHTQAIVLDSGTGGLVVAPELQGRVMTSALRWTDTGLGFVDHEAVADPPPPGSVPFHNYGGEDRFWLGPEGGPYALFFTGDRERVVDDWQVPAGLDEGAFAVMGLSAGSVHMKRTIRLENALGTEFVVDLQRTIDVPARAQVEAWCGPLPAGTEWVAFRSRTRVTNGGEETWNRARGLLCAWSLGMFDARSPRWVVAPFRTEVAEPAGESRPPVEDGYFGVPGPERLRVGDGFAVFRADAKLRSKIGILRDRARPAIGAWDEERGILTVVFFGPIDPAAPYLSEIWNLAGADPYYGDVANSYNHGGPEPFFELESSSPALALARGESHTHEHATVHLRPPDHAAAAALFERALGVDWEAFRALAELD